MAAKTIGYLVCLLIMVMDITAGILGIQAEIAQNKVLHSQVYKTYIIKGTFKISDIFWLLFYIGEKLASVDF